MKLYLVKRRSIDLAIFQFILISSMILRPSALFSQGPLTPAGPPAPTMKTLDQIEARVPLESLAGDATTRFVISAPGSYYLTGDVTVAPNFNGIAIAADNVTIDLNGFSFAGPAGATTDRGIISGSPTPPSNTRILNGTLRGWPGGSIEMAGADRGHFENLSVVDGGGGIAAGEHARVQNCLIADHFGAGIRVLGNSIVEDCIIKNNIGTGIYAAGPSGRPTGIIRRCTITDSGINGIYAGERFVIEDCIVTGSGDDGISAGSYCTLLNCVADNNAGYGVTLAGSVMNCVASNNLYDGFKGSGVFSNCQASGNGTGGFDVGGTVTHCYAVGNDQYGIRVFSGSFVLECSCIANGPGDGTGAGILMEFSHGNRIEGNICRSNDRGIVVETAQHNLIIRNSASVNPESGTPLNYDISAFNSVGEIINVNANGNFVATNPWANLQY